MDSVLDLELKRYEDFLRDVNKEINSYKHETGVIQLPYFDLPVSAGSGVFLDSETYELLDVPDTTDSRQTLVTITPAGLQAAQEKWEQVVHAVAALLEQLGPEDAQALLRIQGRLLQIAACGSLRSCPHG